jgi:hypothetical protein
MNKYKCYTEYSRRNLQDYQFEHEFNGTPFGGDTIMHNEERWIVERREWRDAELVLIIRESGGLVLA